MSHLAKKMPELQMWPVENVYDRTNEFKKDDSILDPVETRALRIAKGMVKLELEHQIKHGGVIPSKKGLREKEKKASKSPGKGKGKGKNRSVVKKSAEMKNKRDEEI